MPTAQSMVGNEVDDDPKPLHGQAESQEALLSGKQNNVTTQVPVAGS
jgi:hypothetical protein